MRGCFCVCMFPGNVLVEGMLQTKKTVLQEHSLTENNDSVAFTSDTDLQPYSEETLRT